MAGLPIRRLTTEERELREEAEAERYAAVYAEIEAQERAEYDQEFSANYRLKRPFEPNGRRVHEKTMIRLRAEQY